MGSFVIYVVAVSLTQDLYGEGQENALVSRTVTPENKFLEDQIAALERRVTLLELAGHAFDVEENESPLGTMDLYGDCATPEQPTKPHPKRRGAPQKMKDEDFEPRRDDYVRWVEALWPEFEEVTSSPGSDGELKEKLLRRFPARDGDRLFQMLLANISELNCYLTSKSNTGEPRRIAYVLAGLSGGLTWKYSLERGRKNHPKSAFNSAPCESISSAVIRLGIAI